MSVVIHRYFSHKAFKTSRTFQFILALWASITLIRGPLKFASGHRYHHKNSDMETDLHSPRHGFIRAYCIWIFSRDYDESKLAKVNDLRKFPELVFIERFYYLPSLILALCFYTLGGFNYLVWGTFVSTISSWHLTFFITSVFHTQGIARYNTGDDSKNIWWLSLITFGESWHNNHHFQMNSAELSSKSSEIDLGFMIIRFLEKLGLVYDVKRFDRSKIDVKEILILNK